jgi:hypothetical protein
MSGLIKSNHTDPIPKISKKSRQDKTDAFWIEFIKPLSLYRFVADDSQLTSNQFISNKTQLHHQPILLVHGHNSSHLTWNQLALSLWSLGYRHIFAIDLFSVENKDESKLYSQLHASVDIILKFVPNYNFIYAFGHSLGGILLRSYIKTFKSERNKIRFCVTLGSPHHGMFSKLIRFKKIIQALSEKIISANETTIKLFSPDKKGHLDRINSIVTKEEYHKITMINIMGSLKRYANSDATFKPKPVSDMINFVIPASHFTLNKSEHTINFISDLLLEKRRIFKFRLIYIEHKTRDFQPYKMQFSFQKQSNKEPILFPTDKYLLISQPDLVPGIPYIVYTDVYNPIEFENNFVTIIVNKVLNSQVKKSKKVIIQEKINIYEKSLFTPITFLTLTSMSKELSITLELLTYSVGREIS